MIEYYKLIMATLFCCITVLIPIYLLVPKQKEIKIDFKYYIGLFIYKSGKLFNPLIIYLANFMLIPSMIVIIIENLFGVGINTNESYGQAVIALIIGIPLSIPYIIFLAMSETHYKEKKNIF